MVIRLILYPIMAKKKKLNITPYLLLRTGTKCCFYFITSTMRKRSQTDFDSVVEFG